MVNRVSTVNEGSGTSSRLCQDRAPRTSPEITTMRERATERSPILISSSPECSSQTAAKKISSGRNISPCDLGEPSRSLKRGREKGAGETDRVEKKKEQVLVCGLMWRSQSVCISSTNLRDNCMYSVYVDCFVHVHWT